MASKSSRGRRRRAGEQQGRPRKASAIPGRSRADLLVCALLAAAVIAVFAGTLQNGFVGSDDDFYVYQNPHVLSGLNPSAIAWAFSTWYYGWWHPVTWLSHMLDVQLFGLNPAGHHATSLLLHIANTLLLYLLLSSMTGARWRSAAAAALFGLHPMRVESVAWVSERKDLLSAFFGLLAIAAYLRYVRGKAKAAYATSLVLFAFSLASKSMLVTLPFLLLLLDWWPLERLERSRAGALLLEKLPYLVLSAASGFLTLVTQRHGRATMTLPLAVRIDNAVLSYLSYIGKLFYPMRLAFLYPHPAVTHGWLTAAAALALLSITATCLFFGTRHRYLAWGWFWYTGALVPVLGLVQVGRQAMADRYTYVPEIGLVVIVVWGISDLTRGWRWRHVALATAMGACLLALSWLTVLQIRTWHDTTTLFEHALTVTHENAFMEVALGRWTQAVEHLEKIARLQPNSPEILYTLGAALENSGRVAEARERYEAALRLKSEYPEAHSNLGLLLLRQGEPLEALPHLSETARLAPDYPQAHEDLATCLKILGREDEAARELAEARRLSSGAPGKAAASTVRQP